jgi:hypothetical protein
MASMHVFPNDCCFWKDTPSSFLFLIYLFRWTVQFHIPPWRMAAYAVSSQAQWLTHKMLREIT